MHTRIVPGNSSSLKCLSSQARNSLTPLGDRSNSPTGISRRVVAAPGRLQGKKAASKVAFATSSPAQDTSDSRRSFVETVMIQSSYQFGGHLTLLALFGL